LRCFCWQATRLTDEETVWVAPKPKANKPPVAIKRGARCVDEEVEVVEKKSRPSKRDAGSIKDATRKLHSEAMEIVLKLVNVDHVHVTKPDAPKAAMPPPPPPQPQRLDPRLQNVEFVRTAALKKLVADASKGLRPLNLNTIHDTCVHANEFVRKQRALQQARDGDALKDPSTAGKKQLQVFDGQVIRCCADLIVHLWLAVCTTTYMQQNRRNNDSFRPFAAGTLYALKRGLYLPNGVCIVPELPNVAEQLPQLRSQQASSVAKNLQSSSHRGLCSIHRSIASIEEETDQEQIAITREKFRNVSCVAANLRALCTRD
jgi:hypothetical protein